MKRLGMKWGATMVGSACVVLLTASVGNAGLIPWVWNGLFGPNCPKNNCAPACAPACGPSCAPCSPCGSGGCGIQSSYYVPSGCSSCGTSVCGVSGCDTGSCGPGGCPSGGCGISIPATSARTPEPDNSVPPTFKEGDNGTSGEKGWNPSANEPPPMPGSEAGEVDAYKPPAPVPGKDAPAPTPAIGEPNPSDTPSAGDAAEEGDANNGPNLINELHKVSWQPVVGQQRLKRTPTYAKAQVTRRPKQAKGEWLVVPSTENIAKR